MDTLKEKTAKSFFWGAMNNGVTQLLNFIIGIFLLRLLTPSDYGIVGVLTIFTLIAGNIQACGFTQGLSNLKSPTANDYNSVFWFNIIVSVAIYIILFISAPLIAWFFHQPKLISLSRFTFLSFLISSFGISRNAYMHKNMMNKERAIIGFVALMSSGTAGITLASCGYAYWSLAWQQVIYITVANMGRYYYTHKCWKPSLRIDFSPVKRMFGFSVKLLLTSIINTLGGNILTFIFGRYLPINAVGNFSQANKWNTMGHTTVSGMIDQVAQPVLVEVSDDKSREKRVFRKMLSLSALLSFPALWGLAMIADDFTIVLLSEKWADSVPLLRLLCISGAFMPFYNMFQQLSISNGRSDIYLKCSSLQIILQVAFIMLFIHEGVVVMTGAYAIFTILYLLVWFFCVRKLISISLKEVFKDIFPFVSTAAIAMTATYFATLFISIAEIRLVIRIVVAALLYFGVMKIARIEMFDECMNFFMRKLGKRK